MKLINKALNYLFRENKWKYRLTHSSVRIHNGGHFTVGNNCKIRNSTIVVDKEGTLQLGDDVIVTNASIYVGKGYLYIGSCNILQDCNLNISEGCMKTGHHTKLALRRVWVRFKGKLTIGNFTNINSRSEIRADERISIGDYTRISYDVNIWDTNTHVMYPSEKRRKILREYWPYYGMELEKPITSPVFIGDDCWIGQSVTIMKGSHIGDSSIIGYGSMIIGKKIEAGSKVVPESNIRIIQ